MEYFEENALPKKKKKRGQDRLACTVLWLTIGIVLCSGVGLGLFLLLRDEVEPGPDPDAPRVMTFEHSRNGNAFAWSTDGRQIVTSNGASLTILDAQSGRNIRSVQLRETITALAWHDDRIAAADDNGILHIFDSNTLRELQTLDGQSPPILELAWSPSTTGDFLASRNETNVHTWDVGRGSNVTQIAVEISPGLTELGYSPNGEFFAANSPSQLVVWTATSGRERYSTPAEVVDFTWLDDDRLGWVSIDGAYCEWVLENSPQCIETPATNIATVSPDGNWIAYVNQDVIQLFDLELMEVTEGITVNVAPEELSIAPNGRTLLAADTILRFWVLQN